MSFFDGLDHLTLWHKRDAPAVTADELLDCREQWDVVRVMRFDVRPFRCHVPEGPIDYLSGPPVQYFASTLLVGGHNPDQLANCFSLGKALRSAPASAITVCAVRTSMPLICAQSIP
jgi:hypothetical protein